MNFFPLDAISNLLSAFRGGFDRYSNSYFFNSESKKIGDSTPVWVSVNGHEIEMFKTLAELNMVISRKAEMFSNGVWVHKKEDGTIIKNSPFVKLMNNPHLLHTRSEFLKQEVINKSLFGCSFIHPLDGLLTMKASIPKGLALLSSNDVKIYPTGKTINTTSISDAIQKFAYAEGTTAKQDFKPDELIYQKLANPENHILPFRPLEAIAMEISNLKESKGFTNVSYREKGAFGMLSGGGGKDVDGGNIKLSEKDRERIEQQHQKSYGWKRGQRKIIITQTPVSWVQMGSPMKDFDSVNINSENFKTICNYYNLHPTIFQANATYENANQAEKSTYQNGIIPYAKDFCYNLNSYFGLLEKGEYLELDYSHIEALRENEQTRSEVANKNAQTFKLLMESGQFTADEAKKISGLVE